MPRRCRGIRGDVGIAPYGISIGGAVHQRLSLRRFALPPPSQREALELRACGRGNADCHGREAPSQ